MTLHYCRGNFLFLGDVHHLPPIVMNNYDLHDPDDNENNKLLIITDLGDWVGER
jgi:hypothetical protein